MELPTTKYLLPIDGFGGSLYHMRFSVPTYFASPEIYSTLTWADIDVYYRDAAYAAVINAIALTICTVVLLYVVALTHPQRRRLWIHSSILSALIFQIICHGVGARLSLHSPRTSAYIQLTNDVMMLRLSFGYKALSATFHTTACIAFACLQACFYLQAKPLLTLVKIRHIWLYRSLLGFMILNGLAAFALRLAMAVLIMVNLDDPFSPSFPTPDTPIFRAHVLLFALSIGAWSLVFFISTITMTVKRRGQLISRNTIYQGTLNVITIVGLESFSVPLILAVFVAIQYVNPALSHAFQMLLTSSVLVLLPLCSLFASSRTYHGEATPNCKVNHDRRPTSTQRCGKSSAPLNYYQSTCLLNAVDTNASPDAPTRAGIETVNEQSGYNFPSLSLKSNTINAIPIEHAESKTEGTV